MSKDRTETYDDNVEIVEKVIHLPYAYVPYSSFRAARAANPDAKLYIFEPGAPVGYKIVALPILMNAPAKGFDIQGRTFVEASRE